MTNLHPSLAKRALRVSKSFIGRKASYVPIGISPVSSIGLGETVTIRSYKVARGKDCTLVEVERDNGEKEVVLFSDLAGVRRF